MPCRALEAFRPTAEGYARATATARLNALSGIGGVQTLGQVLRVPAEVAGYVLMPCRALEAFRRPPASSAGGFAMKSLNALSGIGGVQTLLLEEAALRRGIRS